MPRVRSSTATTSANRLVTLSSWMSGASEIASATLTRVLLRVPRAAHSVARSGTSQGRTREKAPGSLYGTAYQGGAVGLISRGCAARDRADRRLLPRGGLRPDQQLRGHRRVSPAPGCPGGVHHRGVLRRDTRGPR